jgi:hypothetical protein
MPKQTQKQLNKQLKSIMGYVEAIIRKENTQYLCHDLTRGFKIATADDRDYIREEVVKQFVRRNRQSILCRERFEILSTHNLLPESVVQEIEFNTIQQLQLPGLIA